MQNENLAQQEKNSLALIQKRMEGNNRTLQEISASLNKERNEAFKKIDLTLATTLSLKSNVNAIPIDIVNINGYILAGYKTEKTVVQKTELSDIFSYAKIENDDIDNFSVKEQNPFDSILFEEKFKTEFAHLFRYYKSAEFYQFIKTTSSLLIVFKIGADLENIKAYRWDIDRNSNYKYVGEVQGSTLIPNIQKELVKFEEAMISSNKKNGIEISSELFLNNYKGKATFTHTKNGIIFEEDLTQKLQSIEDSKLLKVKMGNLILIKFMPYNELPRFYIFDEVSRKIIKTENFEYSLQELPENNGIIFANGFYLNDGQYKQFSFDLDANKHENYKSPNGEDYLFVFYSRRNNNYIIYNYNLVSKEMTPPVIAKGVTLLDNGGLIVLKESEELSTVHYIQIWRSPYFSDNYYNELLKNTKETRISKIGNNEIVKAIGSINSIINFIANKEISVPVYNTIINMIETTVDTYHWLNEFNDIKVVPTLHEVKDTAQQVINEYQKVEELKAFAKNKITKAKENFEEINRVSRTKTNELNHMLDVLVNIKAFIGQTFILKEDRYIDAAIIDSLLETAEKRRIEINNIIIELLDKPETYSALTTAIKEIGQDIDTENSYKNIKELNIKINHITKNLSILNQEINSLDFEDNSLLAEILEKIASVFAIVNQVKSRGKQKEQDLAFEEAKIEFASHSKLLEQTLKNSLNNAETLDKTEDEYAKVLALLQEQEARFSEFNTDEFTLTISKQREDILSAFGSHKQKLRAELQKKTENLVNAIKVSLRSIQNKVGQAETVNEVSSIFLTDGIVLRAKKLISQVRELGDVSQSEDLDAQLRKIEKDAIKKVRDDLDIFENGGSVLKLGSYRFAVNKRPFEVVLIKREGKVYTHIETTDYYKEIDLSTINEQLYKYWNYDFISESNNLYRAEYLVYSILDDIKNKRNDLSPEIINDIFKKGIRFTKNYSLLNLVQDYSSKLYKEGYIKGIHDNDAAAILKAILEQQEKAHELQYNSTDRLTAWILRARITLTEQKHDDKIEKDIDKGLKLLAKINTPLLLNSAIKELKDELQTERDFSLDSLDYLVNYTKKEDVKTSIQVKDFYDTMFKELNEFILDFKESFEEKENFEDKMSIIKDFGLFIEAYCNHHNLTKSLINEVIIYFIRKEILEAEISAEKIEYLIEINNLYGEHPNIKNGTLIFTTEDFNVRNKYHREHIIPAYDGVDEFKKKTLDKEKEFININSFKSKPLTSFVKNKLISESYFPKFGANLAKQIGETGESRKSDTMGMLLLTSPPGYGKTTLVEYVVNKLGMVFVKINCPSIGHNVTSLDPNDAPDLTARKEIEKINLSFEMGNNVCLYLDDIQHTNPEFLQKFIPLCDGTRTVEGVWEGKSKTYNLRNKRFAVIMAGNPYTESGESFKIPDMLANRADTYNLGDISSDDRTVFEMSYIENAIVNNPTTEPLTNRSMKDIYLFLKMVDGLEVNREDFDYEYSGIEIEEIIKVLKMMKKVQSVVLKVNEQYIYSASQNNEYRNEPPFKLQGSYRNMSKIVEKILPLMTEKEIDNLIMDHYQAESQTLTKSNEENLLKFKEIFNIMTEKEKERWIELKNTFKKLNGSNDKVILQEISDSLNNIAETMKNNK